MSKKKRKKAIFLENDLCLSEILPNYVLGLFFQIKQLKMAKPFRKRPNGNPRLESSKAASSFGPPAYLTLTLNIRKHSKFFSNEKHCRQNRNGIRNK